METHHTNNRTIDSWVSWQCCLTGIRLCRSDVSGVWLADESQVYADPALSQFAIVRWEFGIRHLRASGNSCHTTEATTLPQGLRFQTACLPVLCPTSYLPRWLQLSQIPIPTTYKLHQCVVSCKSYFPSLRVSQALLSGLQESVILQAWVWHFSCFRVRADEGSDPTIFYARACEPTQQPNPLQVV